MIGRRITRGVAAPARALGRVVPRSVSSRFGGPRCQRCSGRFDDDGRCRECGLQLRLSAPEWIALLADGDSFAQFPVSSLDADPIAFADDVPYHERIRRVRLETGLDESVTTGRARIGGRPVVLVVFDFRFFGGSLGVVAGEKIVRALTAAAEERIPVVMLVSSSGARVQEGLPALYQMPRTSAAVTRLRAAGVPFVSILADPTMGAPYASCANLADVVLAERGALVGFAGPRVVSSLTGRSTTGVRAEELSAAGAVDAVVARRDLRDQLALVLRLLGGNAGPEATDTISLPDPLPPRDRWAQLQSIRDPAWPTGVAWLESLADRRFELGGDRAGCDDPGLVCALAEIGGTNVVVLAQNRLAGDGLIGPGGYRKALRALRVAARLGLPVISLVDTGGAVVGPDADRAAISYWLAECFAALIELPVPVISLVVGQGSSGGALALAVADRLYMLEQATFAVISPEGAAAILEDDPRSPAELSDAMKLTAADAFALGLADRVLPGPGRRAQVRQVRQLLAADLVALRRRKPSEFASARRDRYFGLTRDLIVRRAPIAGTEVARAVGAS
jgi:acetyl-CoA carboxylase carboxyl transferase subunit beta